MRTADLPLGTEAVSPPVHITEEMGRLAREVGGYTHPLFDAAPYPRPGLPFERRPIPGELTLFLLGGLAEQTGLFDDSVVALVGIDEVRFHLPAAVGDSLRLELEVIDRRTTTAGDKVVVTFRWRAVNQDDSEVLDARISMLCVGSDDRRADGDAS